MNLYDNHDNKFLQGQKHGVFLKAWISMFSKIFQKGDKEKERMFFAYAYNTEIRHG